MPVKIVITKQPHSSILSDAIGQIINELNIREVLQLSDTNKLDSTTSISGIKLCFYIT
jgi:hypothetical protein